MEGLKSHTAEGVERSLFSHLLYLFAKLPFTTLQLSVRASPIAQFVKNPPAMQETSVGKTHWRRDGLPTPVFLGFPDGSAGEEFTCNAGDLSSIPGLGRSPGEGKGYPLHYSGLENSMDCIIHGVDDKKVKGTQI